MSAKIFHVYGRYSEDGTHGVGRTCCGIELGKNSEHLGYSQSVPDIDTGNLLDVFHICFVGDENALGSFRQYVDNVCTACVTSSTYGLLVLKALERE